MKEPDIMQQIDDLKQQYIDCLISNKEYEEQLERIRYQYDEWLKRNE